MNEPDLLHGVKEIANHLRKTERQIEHWVSRGLIPTFRIGGSICATKSGLAEFFDARMRESAEIRGTARESGKAQSG